jgi:carbonic anhydrase/acetyltransferase-like protein (isoleucine patch superfamily)
MHATLLNGCVIGENSIIGAGALVKEGQVIPPASLAVGVPAKVVRTLSPEQYEGNRENAAHYSHLAKEYRE